MLQNTIQLPRHPDAITLNQSCIATEMVRLNDGFATLDNTNCICMVYSKLGFSYMLNGNHMYTYKSMYSDISLAKSTIFIPLSQCDMYFPGMCVSCTRIPRDAWVFHHTHITKLNINWLQVTVMCLLWNFTDFHIFTWIWAFYLIPCRFCMRLLCDCMDWSSCTYS